MKSLRRVAKISLALWILSYVYGGRAAMADPGQSTTVESRAVTVRIDRPFAEVYAFLVDPANWNRWAFGLGKNIRRSQGGWIADSGGGIARVRFTPQNRFGVVDHTIIRPSGQRIYVPMRLIANGSGCELIFTLFRERNMSDAQFASDGDFVQRDLNGLKRLLEP
ncbi:SRPBCC family protein [Acidobacteria bacterium AB60]|nr:SRPBCC family protein [Acidobacteria bacterium AB60]